MSRRETAKRYGLFVVGLFFSALGVAFTKSGGLGVSPISSVANVMSYRFTALSMGTWLILWNCVLILGQIVILRRRFQPIQLLQVPMSFLFGWFTDLGMWLLSPIPTGAYWVRLALVLVGIAVLGFGIAVALAANVIMNSGEAFVKAIADETHRDFGNVKIAFDVFCVITAILLSLCMFRFTVVGTREGTVLSALLTGVAIKFFSKRVNEPLNRLMRKN